MAIAYLTLLSLTAVWGFTFPVVQTALSSASPLVFLSLRFALAAVLFGVFFWPRAFRFTRAQLLRGLWLGFLLWAGYVFQTVGLAHTTAARSGFLTGTLVPMTPLFSWLIFRERIGVRMWLAALLAFAGTFTMSRPEAGGFNFGDVLTLFCAVGFSLQVVFVGRWANEQNESPLTFIQLGFTSLLSALILPLESPHLTFTPYLAFAIGVTGIFGSAVGIWAQLRFQPRISATAAAIIYACEPMFAGVAAWIMLGDVPPPSTLFGAALIISGMVLSSIHTQSRLTAS